MANRSYPAAAVERAMKVQEVLLRAIDGRLKWYQAAEVLGVSDRQMRRMKRRYERHGYDGLVDRRRQQPSPRRVPLAQVREVLTLYRERYPGFNVLHFHEKLTQVHHIPLSYTWVKTALQTAGLIPREKRRGPHRQARPRRPVPGMLVHTDASTHVWLAGQPPQDLIVVLDDATSEVYYAQFVPEESTRTMLTALQAVVTQQGVFCALYVDRASHFITTRTGASPHQPQQAAQLTQIQRALVQLGTTLIPANSPQARGRMERLWETWQGRLPQELALAGITTWEAANVFLARTFVAYHNQRWAVPAAETGTAFVPYGGNQLERIFALQHERVVGQDNCVAFERRRFQIPPAAWRYSFARCRVMVYEHLDGTVSLGHGPQTLGRYAADGTLLAPGALSHGDLSLSAGPRPRAEPRPIAVPEATGAAEYLQKGSGLAAEAVGTAPG